MRRGDKYADIFDSPETIATAKSQGYELVIERETGKKQADTKVDESENDEKTEVKTQKSKRQ